jgi:glycosyltransferase involved in cell wall biosynthesis
VRILVFHGYLLRGTGSNVYNHSLASALVSQGHEVHLLCQDREPFEFDFVDAQATWSDGDLGVEERRRPARCTVYRPDIGGLLPVYVADRYEGIEARPFGELEDHELDRYLGANVEAVRAVAERARPDVALANHLVMGPAILARALDDVPYAVKVHGSALEYAVKPHPRFLPYAREGLARAQAVLVGSRHTAESLWTAMDDPELPDRTRLGPPGVNVQAFSPREPGPAASELRSLAERLASIGPTSGDTDSAFARDSAAAGRALAGLDPDRDLLVAFVGKLILSKGIDLLLAAWPLVLEREPRARLVVVGFGAFREGAERMTTALAAGDLGHVGELARIGRQAEDGPPGTLTFLTAFVDGLAHDGERRSRYLTAAQALPEQVVFCGRLEHDELTAVLPACQALVVPSTFPEAFGMVAAEAAACGALPISAGHSGLAEVSAALADTLPESARGLLSFDLGPRAVADLAERVCEWLAAPAGLREQTRRALVATARERYSWARVARGVIAAAQGRLDLLDPPGGPSPAASIDARLG